MIDLIIKNGKVATASDLFDCDIGIDKEKIVFLENNTSREAKKIIDANGKYVLPGGVDGHCHLDQRTKDGSKNSDNFESGSRSAAFGGTTTVMPFAIQFKGESLREVIDEYHTRANNQSYIDYTFHPIISDASPNVIGQELPAIVKDGYTHFKIYMTYDDLQLNDKEILDTLEAAGKEKAVVMIHAENYECLKWLTEKLENAGKTDPIHHAESRPGVVESEATNRAIALSRITNTPIYFVHVSDKEAIDTIRSAQNKGFKIYAETCPQYLFLKKDDLNKDDFEGAKYICSPPPRDPENQKYVWRGIQNGTFNVLSSDHAPFNFDDKKGKMLKGKKTPFKHVPNGVPGIETRLTLLLSEGVMKKKISINKFVEVTSTNPAKIFGLYPKKGTIAIGSDADIVIWDTDIDSTITNNELHHDTDYTPYEGIKVTCCPNIVINRGSIVVEDGKLKGKKGNGKFLKSDISNYVY
jgi:dihydropyrimidinase|tara:strand:+ start:178 stop:1581 length:1404 start_codon:yes stop_codon:yes gene_type:complete